MGQETILVVDYEKEIGKLKEMRRQKNQLITNVSHDLRIPLTSIMGELGIMKEKRITKILKKPVYIGIHRFFQVCVNYNKLISSCFSNFVSILSVISCSKFLKFLDLQINLKVKIIFPTSTEV